MTWYATRLSNRKPALARALALAPILMAFATYAQAQTAPASTDPSTRPMNIPNVTAFFYQQPLVLNREQHKSLRLQPADASFASKNQSVPLVAAEFPEACLEYPIVFSQGADGQWLALALTGLKKDVNAFVDGQGQWDARYVPASVRRYPFILAQGENNQLSLAIDMAAPQLGATGEALFNEAGEPTEMTKKIMSMLGDFQSQAKQTEALAKQLSDAGLLIQQNLQVRLDEERTALVEGVWIVDEAKLRQLPDDKILAWFKGGQLTAIHAHMLSLRNLSPLLARSQPATQPVKAVKKPAATRKGKPAS